jgi:hypothetical protein
MICTSQPAPARELSCSSQVCTRPVSLSRRRQTEDHRLALNLAGAVRAVLVSCERVAGDFVLDGLGGTAGLPPSASSSVKDSNTRS